MRKYLNELYRYQTLENKVQKISDERIRLQLKIDKVERMKPGEAREAWLKDLHSQMVDLDDHWIDNTTWRQRSREGIPLEVMEEFSALIKGSPIEVLAKAVRNKYCEHCHSTISDEGREILRRNKGIVKCGECGRILVPRCRW